MFVYFTILKIAMIALLQGFCHFGGGVLASLIIGSVLEYIGAVLLGECENFVVREILFYFPGMLLQIIPIYIVSAQYLALSESEMNFIMAIAIGWAGVLQAALWFGNAFRGAAGFAVTYGASIVVFIVNAILNIFMSFHALLVFNFVIGSLGLLVAVIARLALGSNME